MKQPTLYEISAAYQFLLSDLYNEDTGEINESVLIKLNDISDTAENKCINVVKVFKEFEKEHKAIQDERKKMEKREKAFKSEIDSLKEYLLTNMELCEINKIECPQFVISLQKNPPSVNYYNKDEIPDEYKTISVDYDTQRISEDLKKGIDVPGARLIQGNSVRIR